MSQGDASDLGVKAGYVAWFVYLHHDTARFLRLVKREEKKFYLYEIEAKARPMIVLSESRREKGINWYHVVHATASMGLDENGIVKKGYMRIGKILDPEKESFASLYPEWYPENLLSKDERHMQLKKQLDREDFDNLMRNIRHIGLRAD